MTFIFFSLCVRGSRLNWEWMMTTDRVVGVPLSPSLHTFFFCSLTSWWFSCKCLPKHLQTEGEGGGIPCSCLWCVWFWSEVASSFIPGREVMCRRAPTGRPPLSGMECSTPTCTTGRTRRRDPPLLWRCLLLAGWSSLQIFEQNQEQSIFPSRILTKIISHPLPSL